MDYTIEYSDFFYVQTENIFNIDDFIKLADDLLNHEQWQPGASCIFDYRKTSFEQIGADDLITAGQKHLVLNERIGPGKSALVFDRFLDFGKGRIYQNHYQNDFQSTVLITMDIEEALNWIRKEHLIPR